MSTATYDDISKLLGEVDDLTIERIVHTGASAEEVAQALEELEDERNFGEQLWLDESPRVAAVRAILDDALDEGDEGDALPVQGESP